MQQKMRNRQCRAGRLPAMAPMAYPYVPFQPDDPPKYEPRMALVRGTLYPQLDLPFRGMTNNKEKPVTSMTELQTMSFAIQELALYLDTHRDDKEALVMYHAFQKMYERCKKEYEEKHGPLTHMSHNGNEYRWLDDPWPWEYAKNREV